jgi:hypothetical protein
MAVKWPIPLINCINFHSRNQTLLVFHGKSKAQGLGTKMYQFHKSFLLFSTQNYGGPEVQNTNAKAKTEIQESKHKRKSKNTNARVETQTILIPIRLPEVAILCISISIFSLRWLFYAYFYLLGRY